MGKLRVHELAKKINMSNQDVIAMLNARGVVVRTHSSSIDEQEALRALGIAPGGDTAKAGLRPRTVLRRRPQEAEESVEGQAEQPEALEESSVSKLPTKVPTQEIIEPVLEPLPTPPEPKAAVVFHKEEKKEINVPLAPIETPPEPRSPVTQSTTPVPAPRAPGSVPEHSPSNVVRVINADAIKARLAAEGRSFQRRGPGTGGGGGRPGGGGGPSRFGGGGGSGPRGPGGGAPSYGARSGPGAAGDRQGPGGGGPGAQARSGSNAPGSSAPSHVPGGGQAPGSGGGPGGPGAARPGGRPNKKKRGSTSYSKDKDSSSGGRELWLAPGRKKKSGLKSRGKGPVLTQAAAHKRVVEMTDAISVNELAHRMSIKAGQVIAKLLSMGMMVTVNEAIDFDTASIIAGEFGFEIKNVGFEETNLIKEELDSSESLVPRPAIITVMGHVDHGKTSVLDALRKTSVVAGEAGGITQHIGAYSVETSHGIVTFLDTPGHEAFTSMRARGAQVTDIVVLVVAADDGVMPQTREAIDHAKAAKVPVVVAVNKCDLPDAKPERVMQQLSELGLLSEEWGGDTQFFKISALRQTGLDKLVEGLGILAEVLDLRANPNKAAAGVVVEAKLDKGRGPVATILTQSGTLHQGDYIVAGECLGRVRAMYDSNGKQLKSAGPSIPVQVLGLSAVPLAGDQVNAVADDKTAKTIANHRALKIREKELLKTKRVSLETFLSQAPVEEAHVLRLIVKADVYGSAEALNASLQNLSTKEVKVEIVHTGVGTITESNVNLAMASKAIIIGFNIKADGKAQALAQQEKVDIRYYSVIYEALDEVRKAMAGLLAPIVEERYLGKAEVRMIIAVSKHGKIAGSYVLDGKIQRSAKVRLLRKDKEIYVGSISSLKRFKDDVKEVGAGYECGINLEGFDDLQEGDILECFDLKEVEAKLSEAISSQEVKNKESTSRDEA
jgi:translation initiation factor IF-2